VIAATHRNLASAVETGSCRQDLYYRLNVITIRLPPLRERKQDIPLLVERFLERGSRRYTVTREVMDSLMAYDWPGNVRELQNSIDRMTAVNSGPLLHTMDLPSAVQFSIDADRSKTPVMAAAATGDTVVPLDQVERSAILSALEKTKGDRAAAAHFLGIGRTTLYRKLRGYGIMPSAPAAVPLRA
jgi:DNA-binding NtrC family response regulator